MGLISLKSPKTKKQKPNQISHNGADATRNTAKPAPASTLSLERVTFHYAAAQPLFHDFNWRISDGESWSVLGPSGCGKTTLLYLLAGLRIPTQGHVCFDGIPISEPRRDVGLVLQDFGLLDWYTARQNIELGMKIRGVSRSERRKIVGEWLQRMEINHVADSYPAQLSGGQRQRVALARVLALQTHVLLLDEPFASVDQMTRERLQRLLWELKHELAATLILVTHSVEEAALLGDNILIFTDHTPISQYQVLRSPFNGLMPERDNPDFTRFCAEIRGRLEI